jgi:hypothetical protein
MIYKALRQIKADFKGLRLNSKGYVVIDNFVLRQIYWQ